MDGNTSIDSLSQIRGTPSTTTAILDFARNVFKPGPLALTSIKAELYGGSVVLPVVINSTPCCDSNELSLSKKGTTCDLLMVNILWTLVLPRSQKNLKFFVQ